MKYNDFKIFKFSKILKKINHIKDNFIKGYKDIKSIPSNIAEFFIPFLKSIYNGINKILKFLLRDLIKIFKSLIENIYSFFRAIKYFNIRRYNYSKIYKFFYIKKYKYAATYISSFLLLSILIYFSIPLFFSYEKPKFESLICKGLNVECSIQGEIKYSFIPSPRIKINNLVIKDFINKKKTLGNIENVAIKISLYNLTKKNNLDFTFIEFENAKINLDLHKLKKYQNFLKNKFNSKPIKLSKGEINLLDNAKSIGIIKDVNLKYKKSKKIDDIILNGNFLNEDIYIRLKNKNKKNDFSSIFILKFFDIKAKIDIFKSDLNKNSKSGNFSFKKNKNKISSIFEYKNNQIVFKQSNIRNDFLDGKFSGVLKILPYFDFSLDVDLNGINFNRLSTSILQLNEKNRKNLFRINKKINGELNLSVEKIFSKHTLVNSFESRMRFVNGDIFIEQLLLNLKKLGAADITGVIKNDKKFSNLRFESNIFLDNLKRFYNKFGIYNREDSSSHLFASGNFDFINLKLRLNEIFIDEKFTEEDVVYIDNEFNELLLNEGYESLFNFVNLKEFVQLIMTEKN